MNFEINLTFLIKPFSTWQKSHGKNIFWERKELSRWNNVEFQLIFAKVHCSTTKLKSKEQIGARQTAAFLAKFKIAKTTILTKLKMSILNYVNLWDAIIWRKA